MKTFKLDVENFNISAAIALATLKLGREVSRAEIAEALGMTPQNAIKQKSKELTPEQIKKIETVFNISLSPTATGNPSTFADKIEIKYWGTGLPCEEKLKNPFITSMWFDREVINDGWQKDEKNLNIIAMPGDKMDGGDIPFKNGDILVIDKTQTDISMSGVYFYTTNNDEDVFVNNFRKTFKGGIILGFTNPKYNDDPTTLEELEAANYHVVGRVIKNIFAMI